MNVFLSFYQDGEKSVMRHPHDAICDAVLLLIACDFQNQAIILNYENRIQLVTKQSLQIASCGCE